MSALASTIRPDITKVAAAVGAVGDVAAAPEQPAAARTSRTGARRCI
jgi:hypothetical protein